MPIAAPKPCQVCGVLVHGGGSRCDAHRATHTGAFADRARGSRHERGYGSAWDKLRAQVLARDHGLCQPCKALGVLHLGSHVDHVISKADWRRRYGSLDGVDDPSNLQAINVDCHKAKTSREALQGRGVVKS